MTYRLDTSRFQTSRHDLELDATGSASSRRWYYVDGAVNSMMRRALALAASLLLASCGHLGGSLVATLPTVGPRLVVLGPERALTASPRGVLCLETAEGYTVQPGAAAFARAGGDPVRLRAALARQEGDARWELAVPSRRAGGDASFLCLGAASPPPAGAAFDRVSLSATAPLLVPQIVWIAEPR